MIDRARGMLIGLAVGDALGANLEFGVASSADITDAMVENMSSGMWPKGAWTDDTSMALCLGNSLLACHGYDSYDVMNRYTAWVENGYCSYDGKPATDVGNHVRVAIGQYKAAPVVDKQALRDEGAGNGCIMRLAPTIIASCESQTLAATVELASISARETHFCELAECGTEVFANLLYRSLRLTNKDEITKLDNLYFTRRALATCWQTSGQYVRDKLVSGPEAMKDLGGYVFDALTIAIWAFRQFANFADGLKAVLKLGGDTDTNGAIYGQLAGSYYGLTAIPQQWRDDIYSPAEITNLADALYEMPACPILRTRFQGDPSFAEP